MPGSLRRVMTVVRPEQAGGVCQAWFRSIAFLEKPCSWGIC